MLIQIVDYKAENESKETIQSTLKRFKSIAHKH
jgi:hypothetical protein